MADLIRAVLDALGMSFAIPWEILWALILGFALSAVVQAVVSAAFGCRGSIRSLPTSLSQARRGEAPSRASRGEGGTQRWQGNPGWLVSC